MPLRRRIWQPWRQPAATWAAENPVLKLGEPGLESDTGRMKWGDGVTAWNDLAAEMKWQSAADMVALAGTPTLVTTNGPPSWELDDLDGISGTETPPHYWGNVEPHVVYYAPTADAGTFSLRLRMRMLSFVTNAVAAYGYDQTVNVAAASHPQNLPLPAVFPQAGVISVIDWRLDRVANTMVDTVRILGINWEQR